MNTQSSTSTNKIPELILMSNEILEIRKKINEARLKLQKMKSDLSI